MITQLKGAKFKDSKFEVQRSKLGLEIACLPNG
jgi:hypothetical protein